MIFTHSLPIPSSKECQYRETQLHKKAEKLQLQQEDEKRALEEEERWDVYDDEVDDAHRTETIHLFSSLALDINKLDFHSLTIYDTYEDIEPSKEEMQEENETVFVPLPSTIRKKGMLPVAALGTFVNKDVASVDMFNKKYNHPFYELLLVQDVSL